MSETATARRGSGPFPPFLRWARGYRRATFGADVRAGLAVAVLLIPQGMAYAALAGMPPITGLYAAMVSLVVYAVLGTSNHASVAPVAIDSLLIAAAVAPLAGGDQTRYVALAGLLALLSGGLQIGAGLLRLGTLVSFLSVPVISGFTSAAALTIAASQFKDLLGVSASGTSTTLVDTVRGLLPRLGDTRLLTVAVGVGVIVALVLVRRFVPRLPGPLLVVAAAAVVAALPGLRGALDILGEVPPGLPSPGLPALNWTDARALLPAAAAIALISYLESISTASAFARRTRSRIDPTMELIAVGSANVASGLFRGFGVAGGFSRVAVNFNAGAKTPMSGVVAAAGIAIALLTITPLLALLPKVALAAIIIVAVSSLVDLRGAVAITRVRRSDLAALLTTFGATAVLGPAPGLAVGVGVSLAIFLRQSARPHLPELGRLEGSDTYRNVNRYPVLTDPAAAVLRLDAPLYFANSRGVADTIADIAATRPDLRFIVLDASAITSVDYTGAETLADLEEELQVAGVELHLATVRGPVRDVLGRTRVWRLLVDQHRVHHDVAEAVAALPLRDSSPLRAPRAAPRNAAPV
ncbi:MAG: sulfate permease, partial [Actinomycetota bacterium]|nr:sulfate permease [Actinomycetota bacterium]